MIFLKATYEVIEAYILLYSETDSALTNNIPACFFMF